MDDPLFVIVAGVSVKFLLVGESNSMVGYHLIAEDHLIQLGMWGRCESRSRSREAPWRGLEFFGDFFEYRP